MSRNSLPKVDAEDLGRLRAMAEAARLITVAMDREGLSSSERVALLTRLAHSYAEESRRPHEPNP